MQIDQELKKLDSEAAISPFMTFINQIYPKLNLSNNFEASAKEIFSEAEEERVKEERKT